jgi:membrane-associated protease RseP (regulator of RpoE activity)
MRIRSLVLALALVGMVGLTRAEPSGWLGIYSQGLSEPMQTALGVTRGVLVTEAVDNSPAAKAGLRTGDVILRVDSQEIYTPEDLSHYVGAHPDKGVRVEYLRQGKTEDVDVKLGTRDRQVEFSLSDIPQVASAQVEHLRPSIEGMVGDYLDEIRALRDEITSLEREIEKFRKDLKKLEK